MANTKVSFTPHSGFHPKCALFTYSSLVAHVQMLDLNCNQIGDKGMRSLADALVKGALKNTMVSSTPLILAQA